MIIVRNTKQRVVEKYVSTGEGVVKYEYVQSIVYDSIVKTEEQWREIVQSNEKYLDLGAVWQPCKVWIADSLNPTKRCQMSLDSSEPSFSKNIYLLLELLSTSQVLTSVVDSLGNTVW